MKKTELAAMMTKKVIDRAAKRGISLEAMDMQSMIQIMSCYFISGYSERRQMNQLNRMLDTVEYWNKEHGIA